MEFRVCEVNENYAVSVDGRIKRIASWTDRFRAPANDGIMKIEYDNRKGKLPYGRVGLRSATSVRKYPIHRLVAMAWLPQPTAEDCEIDHIDNNPQNNHASNLRWVCKKENLDRRRTETMGRKKAETDTGEKHIKHPVSRKGVVEKNRFHLYINRKNLHHSSYHLTLEEAVWERSRILQ